LFITDAGRLISNTELTNCPVPVICLIVNKLPKPLFTVHDPGDSRRNDTPDPKIDNSCPPVTVYESRSMTTTLLPPKISDAVIGVTPSGPSNAATVTTLVLESNVNRMLPIPVGPLSM
jgi:hypothetical protein